MERTRKRRARTSRRDRLIQPLGKGDFDVCGFLAKVHKVGFSGPIGLQCDGLQGDPLVHLKPSIKAWQAYSARAGE